MPPLNPKELNKVMEQVGKHDYGYKYGTSARSFCNGSEYAKEIWQVLMKRCLKSVRLLGAHTRSLLVITIQEKWSIEN